MDKLVASNPGAALVPVKMAFNNALAQGKEKGAVAWEVTKEKSAQAWQVTKEKSAEGGRKMKTLMRLDPIPVEGAEEGCFSPSRAALWLAVDKTSKITEFQYTDEQQALSKGKTVAVLCTEEQFLACTNETKFSTGNHPVETLVPIQHLLAAGFEVEFVTLSGKPVVLESWAYPKDGSLNVFSESLKDKLSSPKAISSVKADDYVAVFVPGGHGAMIGLPDSDAVGSLLGDFLKQEKSLCAICHGPAALLALPKDTLKGYKLVAFPDVIDTQTPKIGYLPGQLPWFVCEKLKEKNEGIEFLNKTAGAQVHKDRNLITGASPAAADAFGKLCVDSIFESLEKASSS